MRLKPFFYPIRAGFRALGSELAGFLSLCGFLVVVAPGQLQAQNGAICSAGGRGLYCANTDQCSTNSLATICVDGQCEIPCDDGVGGARASSCGIGETCVPGDTEAGPSHYCHATGFAMDLNLLDNCIGHFINGVRPDLAGDNVCSLEQNIAMMLDQDQNKVFNILDVDLCIRSFLASAPCDAVSQSCADGEVYCDEDAACGRGLYCNLELNKCERECGLIANRELNGLESLDRQCTRPLTVCNYDRGRCEPIDLRTTTCEVDADCPAGAVCLTGSCVPKCYRSTDCPNSSWYCSTSNRCLPLPSPDADAGFVFDPGAYSVLFAQKSLELSAISDDASLPLLVMNVRTKKQEFDNPAVVFGYRLEVEYSRKQDPKCLKDASEWSEAERLDCLINHNEEFVTLVNPFGTVNAAGSAGIDVRLNQAATDNLTPGVYQASITAYYNNGSSDSFRVTYRKPSLSGDYSGRLSIYVDGPNNLLGTTNVSARVFVDKSETIQWHQLLAEQNLAGEQDIFDLTEGFMVTGFIHGADSMVFNQPAALNNAENEIPVRGIYAPSLGRMRLIGVIELAADHCRSDLGLCSDTPQPGELQVRNPFGRPIRRLFEFIGPFDEASHRFHGMYRETISGMGTVPVTFDGGFQLDQVRSNETPLPYDLEPPLLDATASPVVAFSPPEDLLVTIEHEIDEVCPAVDGDSSARAKFATSEAFSQYLASYCAVDGSDASYCAAGSTRSAIFNNLVRFEDQVTKALDAMGNGSGEVLTINDFLRGQIVFCDEDSAATSCIDEAAVRCGLALYRKAILSGREWVNLTDLGTGFDGLHELFCTDDLFSSEERNGCQLAGSAFPTVVTLQEHNRFYRELTQTLRYQAGNELSDGFFALYRAADGAVERSAALSYKQTKLFSAWRLFDDLRQQIFSSESAAVAFSWPMQSFVATGRPWLAQMHAAQMDRLDLLEEIIDLKRRLLVTAEEQDFIFVHHLMHVEYLTQAYLVALQKEWEGESFAYQGQGPEALERGQRIVARVNDTRNPLGIYPRQIFFENSSLGVENWRNYRQQILAGPPGTGLLNEVNAAVQHAVENLKGALADKGSFKTRILQANHQFETEIDGLCGPDVVIDPYGGSCEILSKEQRELETSCEGPNCLYEYNCLDPACKSVVRAFERATGSNLLGTSCDVNTQKYPVSLGNTVRQCVRGQMGTLLQEREKLGLEREQIFSKVNSLLRRIASQAEFIEDTHVQNAALVLFLAGHHAAMDSVEAGLGAAQSAYEYATINAEAADCMVIVGMATGTDCAGSVAAGLAKSSAFLLRSAITAPLSAAKSALDLTKELALHENSYIEEIRRQSMVLDNLTTEVENHIAEYEMLTQMLFNLNVRIDDTYYLARQAAKRHRENTANLVDHLIGSETGSVMRRNQYVQEANAGFHNLMTATYKMAMAFIHNYNLQSQSEQITNRVFQLMTPEDVRDFIYDLDVFEAGYCGGAGVDCDSVNNTQHFRFSIREQLFPSLRDIVDARTGEVLTKGEQFHRIITSPPYLTKRERAGRVVTQIELPFSIWLNDRGDAGGFAQQWMVSPLECNHIIVGNGSGTLAANVIGTRLRNLSYEVWRGDTDFIRGCEAQQVVDQTGTVESRYPINSFIVGYAPQNSLSQEETPPSYMSHSSGFLACKNVPEGGGDYILEERCFNYFARDRSLGSPDWKFIIPFNVGYDNEWILEDDDPIIEDIVLYIRYRTRPVQ